MHAYNYIGLTLNPAKSAPHLQKYKDVHGHIEQRRRLGSIQTGA